MFNINKETNYFYVSVPSQKTIAEFTDIETALAYTSFLKGEFWDHFPHLEYNFTDVFSFCDEWTVLNEYGNIIKYNLTQNGYEEVVVE